MEETIVIEETRATRLKNFVAAHKVAIAVTTTAAVCLVVNRIALKQHEDFIESKGLSDEFHAVGEFEEL